MNERVRELIFALMCFPISTLYLLMFAVMRRLARAILVEAQDTIQTPTAVSSDGIVGGVVGGVVNGVVGGGAGDAPTMITADRRTYRPVLKIRLRNCANPTQAPPSNTTNGNDTTTSNSTNDTNANANGNPNEPSTNNNIGQPQQSQEPQHEAHPSECSSVVVRAELDTASGVSLIGDRLVQLLKASINPGQPQQVQGTFGPSLKLDSVVALRLEPLNIGSSRSRNGGNGSNSSKKSSKKSSKSPLVNLTIFPLRQSQLDAVTDPQPPVPDRVVRQAQDLSIELSDTTEAGYHRILPIDQEIHLVIGQDLLHHFAPQNSIFLSRNEAIVRTEFGYAYQGGLKYPICPSYDLPTHWMDWVPTEFSQALHRVIGTLLHQRSLLFHRWHHRGEHNNTIASLTAETEESNNSGSGSDLINSYLRYMRRHRSFKVELTYLPTIRFVVRNNHVSNSSSERAVIVRALVDSGSDYSILSPRVIRAVGLTPRLISPKVITDMMGTPLYLYSQVQVLLEPYDASESGATLLASAKNGFVNASFEPASTLSLQTSRRRPRSHNPRSVVRPPPMLAAPVPPVSSEAQFVRFYVQPLDGVQYLWRNQMASLIAAAKTEHPDITLADDCTDDSVEVDALIGQDLLTALVENLTTEGGQSVNGGTTIRKPVPDRGLKDSPGLTLHCTKFGWTLAGVKQERLI